MAFEFTEFQSTAETDPTSEFLERERLAAGTLLGNDAGLFGAANEHGGAEHDFEQHAQDFPPLDGEGEFEGSFEAIEVNGGDIVAPAREEAAAFKRADSLMEMFEPREGQESVQTFQKSFPDTYELESGVVPATQEHKEAAYEEPELFLAKETTKDKMFSYDELDTETQALREWNDNQADEVARREAAAERQRGETVSKAEQEIDQFYANYNAEKAKNIKKNKEAEARFLERKQQELAEGTTWTRITKLLDLQNSQSKTIAKVGPGSSDLGRLKELYLNLRREGDTAPGAAGY
ncbi:Clathrin light chain [Malassezia vespertilionis]|uniref:Clathrin light chain n=1 Tax=Malassezia vespertilionis TaxID=2020962 RepID=A0A2N1JAP1_9BASI|nr:Clathrin light chain [Malassezia vespertilionis]PKI83630.1 hypothetical protein MVES_002338 [Malassezia vespertilionis]WFD07118.1 Clathrin light chain [Malassezia vespertilionis]